MPLSIWILGINGSPGFPRTKKRCGKHCIHMIYHIVFFLNGFFTILASQWNTPTGRARRAFETASELDLRSFELYRSF